ncbi:MAG: Mur ligase family protein, partial [Pseudomonadota bacterium]
MPARNLNDLPTLDTLLAGYADAPPVVIRDLAIDSRQVSDGCAFLAVEGLTVHGVEFAEAAMARGAAAIVFDAATADAPAIDASIPIIGVDGLKGALGEIAGRFFARPSEDLAVFGVTGTNGKTTVAWMLARALTALGDRSAYSGTLGQGIEPRPAGESMTSPDVIELNRRLSAFRDAGASAAAIEVSSHALDQGRVDGIGFEATLLTNLSRDHLDYHGDMRAYAAAKAKLFVEHEAKHRIVNVDTKFGQALVEQLGDDAITVSMVRTPS